MISKGKELVGDIISKSHLIVLAMGCGSCISRGGGILLNVNSIGNYCGFNSGVVLGNKGFAEARPELGNNVAFGPGAKAFGQIHIGDNVFVAPNAVVTKDVPSNCIVGGIPAVIIRTKI